MTPRMQGLHEAFTRRGSLTRAEISEVFDYLFRLDRENGNPLYDSQVELEIAGFVQSLPGSRPRRRR